MVSNNVASHPRDQHHHHHHHHHHNSNDVASHPRSVKRWRQKTQLCTQGSSAGHVNLFEKKQFSSNSFHLLLQHQLHSNWNFWSPDFFFAENLEIEYSIINVGGVSTIQLSTQYWCILNIWIPSKLCPVCIFPADCNSQIFNKENARKHLETAKNTNILRGLPPLWLRFFFLQQFCMKTIWEWSTRKIYDYRCFFVSGFCFFLYPLNICWPIV